MAEMSQAEGNPEVSSQANAENSRPVYEVAFHVVPTLDEAGVSSIVEALRAEIAKGNAEIIIDQFPQKIALAYTVERRTRGKREKYNDAYFGFIKSAVEREAIPSLNAFMENTPDVLRHLIVETVREDQAAQRRAIFSSNRLEGETIHKPTSVKETPKEVSEEELQKSIDALVSQ